MKSVHLIFQLPGKQILPDSACLMQISGYTDTDCIQFGRPDDSMRLEWSMHSAYSHYIDLPHKLSENLIGNRYLFSEVWHTFLSDNEIGFRIGANTDTTALTPQLEHDWEVSERPTEKLPHQQIRINYRWLVTSFHPSSNWHVHFHNKLHLVFILTSLA